MKLEDLEAKFLESCQKIGRYYEIDTSQDIKLLEIMLKVQEFFLAKGKHSTAKPVIILDEVSSEPVVKSSKYT